MKKDCPTSWRLQFFKRQNWLKTQSRQQEHSKKGWGQADRSTQRNGKCETYGAAVSSQRSKDCWLQENVTVLNFFCTGLALLSTDTHTGTFAISVLIMHKIKKNIVKESSHTHPSAGGEFDTHTASLCSSRSLRTRVWAEVSSSQFSSSGTFTMWSRVLQPCTHRHKHAQTGSGFLLQGKFGCLSILPPVREMSNKLCCSQNETPCTAFN